MTSSRPSARLVIVGIALTAALSACGSNSSDTASSSTASAPTTAGTSAAAATPSSPAPEAAVVVIVKDMKFTPAHVQVKSGETVTWKFEDGGIPHQITGVRDNALGLNSVILKEGGEYSYTFTAPGTYNYICSIHPDMTGTVEVS